MKAEGRHPGAPGFAAFTRATKLLPRCSMQERQGLRPIISLIIVAIILVYPDGLFGASFLRLWGIPREEIQPWDILHFAESFSAVPIFAVFFNWPFFLLAARVKRTFFKHWPDASAAQAAIIGGLIGLSIPYALYYGVLVPPEIIPLVHHVQDQGENLGWFALVVWPNGWLLAKALGGI
jgi:hypothetical protein